MNETKASRLQALSSIVPVPEFRVVEREQTYPLSFDNSCQYLVRSSSKQEDQQAFSQAGQFSTIGPIDNKNIPAAIQQLFQNDAVDAVIVQNYIEARQSGVVFCFSRECMLVEYASEFEGVTSGTVTPFTALLPTTEPGYKKLETRLLKIYSHFGPSDIEFVNPEDPQFVQVRPITRTFEFDRGFVKLKMQLQQLENTSWHENDVCRMLAERDDRSQAISELYLQALQQVYRLYLNRKIVVPHRPFIKISRQYFMHRSFEQQIIPGFFELLRLGFKMSRILNDIKKQNLAQMSPLELMQQSILMSLAYELFNRKEAMSLREAIRIELDQKIPEKKLEADFFYEKILASSIKFDRRRCIWKSLSLRDEQGIVVVAGNLETGPYYRLKDRNREIPTGVIVVTEQLYPEIGKYISNIQGIICQYGALGAHVAILAREYQVPLRIQTNIEKYE